MVDLRFPLTLPGVPRRQLSRFAGLLSRWHIPKPLRKPLWSFVARRLGIKAETVPGDWADYPNFAALFTRSLPEGLRSFEDHGAWCSPVDGRVADIALVAADRSLTLKGTPYRLGELLPELPDAGPLLALELYLSPRDYHRFHAPIGMRILEAWSHDGDLLPVDPALARRSLRVLSRNRRVGLACQSSHGEAFWMLFVGAFNVGRISFRFDGGLGNPASLGSRRTYDPPPLVGLGEEFGHFVFGSTVVVLAPAGSQPLVATGERVLVGQPLLAPTAD